MQEFLKKCFAQWEKDYHEVTANHIVSAGESDKTRHFWPPFCTFNAQTARHFNKLFVPLQSRYVMA